MKLCCILKAVCVYLISDHDPGKNVEYIPRYLRKGPMPVAQEASNLVIEVRSRVLKNVTRMCADNAILISFQKPNGKQ
jgi:hypothetical protein